MTVPNALWLYPVRFDASSYVLRVKCDGVTEDLAFPASGSLTIGRDYWVSGDGQTGTESDGTGRADLVAMLQATLRTHSHASGATVTYSATTNLLTVTSGGIALLQLLWSAGATTLAAGIFGWISGVDSSYLASQAAPRAALGSLPFGRPVADDSRLYQPIAGGVAESLSGLTRVSRLATPAKRRDWGFRLLTRDVALVEYATGLGTTTVEYAWVNALAAGYPFRAYAQPSDVASVAYGLYRLRDLTYPLARNREHPVWWDATFHAVLAVSVP